MYFAIIGDIIASKTISNRSEVQNHLKRILDQVNEEYKSNIASDDGKTAEVYDKNTKASAAFK